LWWWWWWWWWFVGTESRCYIIWLQSPCQAHNVGAILQYLMSLLFWDVTLHCLLFKLRTFRDSLSVPSSRVMQSFRTAWPFKMRPIRCPETAITNYQSMLCNIPEERRPHLHCGGSPKSCNTIFL
jgi:hypothetical protein